MALQYADVCDKCGTVVVKAETSDSSDMVRVAHLELLYLSDGYLPSMLSRPSLTMKDRVYCPECLLQVIAEWVDTINSLPPSVRRTMVNIDS